MVHGMDVSKGKKRKHGLIEDKDYITEAYLQGGKAIGNLIKKKKGKKPSRKS
jgi:hypothetical protein